MHYQDGTEVSIGDIIKCEENSQPALYGVVIGGYAASDSCNLNVIVLAPGLNGYGSQAYMGAIRDANNKPLATGALTIAFNSCVQSKHSTKIGHIPGVQLSVTA